MFKKHHININTNSLPLAPHFCTLWSKRDRVEPRMMTKIRDQVIKTEVDRLVGWLVDRSVGRSKRSELLIVSRTWSFYTSTFFVRVQAIAWCSSSSVIWRWLLSLFARFWSLRSTLVAVLFFASSFRINSQ